MDFFVWKSSSPQQNFIAETCRKKSNQTEFLRLIAVTKFCCGDKDFPKNSPVHTKRFVAAMCRRNVLLQLVARPVHTEWSVASTCCCNLSPDLYTQSDQWPRLVAATCRSTARRRWSVASTCCCNLSPDLYTRSDQSPRLVAATCHPTARSDQSPRLVAATSRPTCTHGVISRLDLLLQLVARPVHTERYVAST